MPEEVPDLDSAQPSGLYRFQVLNTWKGDADQKEVEVWALANFLMRDLPYYKGEKYIVYAEHNNGQYITIPDFCGPDHQFSDKYVRPILDDYAERVKSIEKQSLEVRLTMNNDASGTITLV